MNKHFNLTAFAQAQHNAVRRVICNSMLGTLNYNLINTADRIAEQLVNEKVAVAELEPRDIKAIMSAVDDQGDVSLQQAGRVRALQAEFYEMLRKTTSRSLSDLTTQHRVRSLADAVKLARDPEKDKAPWGSLERAVADSVGVQNAQDIKDVANKRKQLAAVGLIATDTMIANAREHRRARSQMFADKRAMRVGYITWVIEHMFVMPKGEAWNSFNIIEREFFCEKVITSMGNVETTVTNNVLLGYTGDDVLGIGDLILVRDAKTALEAAMNAADVTKPKAPRAAAKKMQVVKKNGDVHRMNAAAVKATTELLNGVADSSNKVRRTNKLVEKLQAEANGVTTASN